MVRAASRLRFDLRRHADASRITTCDLTIYVDEAAVWPVQGEPEVCVEIQIDDLLAHLTEFWKPLILRQVYPIDVHPFRPSNFRREAERRWNDLPRQTVEAEEDTVSRFEETHDLSRSFAGIYGLPSFWIFRSGDQFIIDSSGIFVQLPFEDVWSALNSVGNEICKILRQVGHQRWAGAINAWNDRNFGDPAGLLAWSTGLDTALARSLITDGILEAPRDFDDVANDNDELRIAARVAGALPHDQILSVINLARSFPALNSERLRKLSKECLEYMNRVHRAARPFEQGEAIARYVRDRLQISDDCFVDIFGLIKDHEIELRHEAADPSTLDGLAIWGTRHGPGVFLNKASKRILRADESDIENSFSARVTLAHELCHLLVDGGHALSAIEVLKARMPMGVEQRAKSFAGELLLPTSIATKYWLGANRPRTSDKLSSLIDQLVRDYRVTRSVAAWKVEHAARNFDVDLGARLDAVAPWR